MTISSPTDLRTTRSNIYNERLHTSPPVTAGSKQPVGVTTSSPPVIQHHQVSEPVSPPSMNNVEHQLPANSPHGWHIPQYFLPTSDSQTSPLHRSASQQLVYMPNSDLSRTSQAVRGPSINQRTSTSQADRGPSIKQRTAGADEPVYSRPTKHHGIRERISPQFTSDKEHQLPATSSQRQHILQYSQRVSDSRTSPTCGSVPEQPAYSPHGDVSRTSQAVTGSSPHHRMSGNFEPVSSIISQSVVPVKPFLPSAEQHVYARPSVSQKLAPVSYQNSDPSGIHYDRFRHHDPTSVSVRLDPYHQRIAPVAQPRPDLSTSDIDGMHRQRTDERSSSWRQPPPAANYKNKSTSEIHVSRSQREMFAVGNEQGQYGGRMLSFGNGPSPRLLKDPYRQHHPAVDGANQLQYDRLRAEPVMSRDHDLNANNRMMTYDAENANNNTAVGVSGIPASYRFSPAATRPPQYSVPAYHGEPNNDLYQYPYPSHVVRHSVSPRPLPPDGYQMNDLRSPTFEPQYNFRSRQVCTESSVLSTVLRLSCPFHWMIITYSRIDIFDGCILLTLVAEIVFLFLFL